jgi:LDH2 family malate/lactate/ureidoglycolate dehydrogenase
MITCWTNTWPNLPPWGTTESRLGNNPMVIAVPRRSGHLVIDMAMSQFSHSALASYRIRGEQLPVEGSFDSERQVKSRFRGDRNLKTAATIWSNGVPVEVSIWRQVQELL